MMSFLHDILIKRGILFVAIGAGVLGLAAIPGAGRPRQEPRPATARTLDSKDWMDLVATVSNDVSAAALLGDAAAPAELQEELRKRNSDVVAFERICVKVRAEAQLLVMVDASTSAPEVPSGSDLLPLSDLLPDVRDDHLDSDSYDAARVALELIAQSKLDQSR